MPVVSVQVAHAQAAPFPMDPPGMAMAFGAAISPADHP
jgi:hypothetical protein